jgi:hypothetical protein
MLCPYLANLKFGHYTAPGVKGGGINPPLHGDGIFGVAS